MHHRELGQIHVALLLVAGVASGQGILKVIRAASANRHNVLKGAAVWLVGPLCHLYAAVCAPRMAKLLPKREASLLAIIDLQNGRGLAQAFVIVFARFVLFTLSHKDSNKKQSLAPQG